MKLFKLNPTAKKPAFGTRHKIALAVALLLIAGIYLFGGAYSLRMGTTVFMYATMAVSWLIIGAYTGYPSFGSAFFFGLGAYTGGIILSNELPMLMAIVAAAAISLVAGTIIGLPLLRVKGHYFAIASLALGELFRQISSAATPITGGGAGLNVPYGGLDALMHAKLIYLLMFVLMVLAIITTLYFERSKLGFGCRCIKQNETSSTMIGINTTLYKALAFGFSGCFVGAAGAVYSAWINYIEPDDVFNVMLSVEPIVMALIGGASTVIGALIGVLVFIGVDEFVWRYFVDWHRVVLGVLIVAILLFAPHGLTDIVRKAKRG